MTRLELANQLIENQPAFHSRSSPLNLAEATGVEPAHAMRGDLANRCPTIRRRLRATKQMKAESDTAHDTRRGTLLLTMAISRTLAKHRDRHPLKAPAFISRKNNYLDYQKTEGAGF